MKETFIQLIDILKVRILIPSIQKKKQSKKQKVDFNNIERRSPGAMYKFQ